MEPSLSSQRKKLHTPKGSEFTEHHFKNHLNQQFLAPAFNETYFPLASIFTFSVETDDTPFPLVLAETSPFSVVATALSY
mmetsp:Transcript_17709/g.35337  ORF Transcript_17709/g.35337 Transcript_17709/m.35337 type:complete len:80 (+) Transcript_17709:148-387(+)